MQVRAQVLGPVEVQVDGRAVPLGSPSQRALLGVLLAQAGRHVPADSLIDVLWGDQPPRTAIHTLRSYVSRLRRHLGARLVSSRDGYTLTLLEGELDADDFASALTSGAAPEDIRSALGLWRGPAFAGVADLAPVRGRARHLEQAYVAAREALCRSLIDAGQSAVPEAEALVADHPLDETGWVLLLAAYGAAGRPAEGLAAYRRARAALDEVGLEPSAALRGAQAELLRPPPLPASEPDPDLIGRERDLEALGSLIRRARLVTVVGTGGVGKTRLALEAGRMAAPGFDAGCRVVELAAVADPSAVPEAVVAALGLTTDAAPARDVLARAGGIDALVVLDNCEHLIDEAAAAVGSLLTRTGPLRVLVTSRERLGVPGEHVWVAEPLGTDGPDPPAQRLFVVRARAARPAAVKAGDQAAVADIVRRLEGMPLAIEMAASRAATLGPADLAARIAEKLDEGIDPLADPRRRGDPRHRSLRAVIEWSKALLAEPEHETLSGWPVFAGGVGAEDADAVLGSAGSGELLAARSLLSVDTSRTPTRFRMLRTVRAAIGPPPPAVSRRQAEHFAAVAEAADAGLRTPEEKVAHDRLGDTFDELRVAHAWARENDVGLAVRLSSSLHLFAVSRLHDQVLGWTARLTPVLGAGPAGSAGPAGPDWAAVNASVAYRLVVSGDLADARRRAEPAAAGGAGAVARMHALESLADIALFEGDLDRCVAHNRELTDVAVTAGDLHYEVFGRGGVPLAHAYAGRTDDAARLLAEADRRFHDEPLAPSDRGWLAYFHGECLLERAPADATAHLADAIRLADSVGNRYLAGVARVSVTSLQARVGEPDHALRLFAEVLDHWLALGSWAHLLTTLRNLVDLLDRVEADEAAAQLWGAVSRPGLTPSYGAEAERLDRAGARLRARLGAPGFAECSGTGAGRALPEAARVALRAVQAAVNA